ncbi:hypothetical protein EG68_09385 [Paragonimus skrjabini miyazakii]|uniref:FERM domain-containing protein n=1 Tax=Paragonimus skrjabini miyazakii TaxID=59628 RepID=A0A8S9YNC8_9TREM|nr:hypothetical protein EG68_09385 [Paragonimus skrjabini miyazakii]
MVSFDRTLFIDDSDGNVREKVNSSMIDLKEMFDKVKEDILSGAISCPFETAILLASYACQAKFGDYDPVRMQPGFFKKERLLPQSIIDQSEQTWEQLEESVVRWYNEHRSMLRSDVMLEYLHIAQDLEMYGVSYFKITNKRGTPLLLGVDAFGLNVYAEDNR